MKTKDGREASVALVTIASSLLAGSWFVYERFVVMPDVTAPDAASFSAPVVVGYTIEQHEEALARRLAELRSDLGRLHEAQLDPVKAQLDEVLRQKADLESSHAARVKELEQARAALERLGGNLPEESLSEAFAALDAGDTAKADALFAEVETAGAVAIGRAATASYERGKLAEADIRWKDAATHFATAARLEPSFENLLKAREFASETADFRSAEIFGTQLIETALSDYGSDTLEHAQALNDHAGTLAGLGRYAEAESLVRKSLQIREALLSRPNSMIAESQAALGVILVARGEYGEAEILAREALEALEAIHSEGLPQYVLGLQVLGRTLGDTGRLAEAEQLYRKALATSQEVFGKTHPWHAVSLSNLAVALFGIGNFIESEALFREVLSLQEKTIGKEHPDYFKSQNNLAMLLLEAGRTDEVEKLLRDVLADQQKALGTENDRYATYISNLAHVLHDAGRLGEAETLSREALEIRERTLGREHPDYGVSLNNLGSTLYSAGRADEAEPLLREALATLEKSAGKEASAYLTCLANLTELLEETGRAAETEPLLREALAIRAKTQGTTHPDYLAALTKLASLLLLEMQRPDEAEPLFRQAVAIHEATAGGDAGEFARALHNLAFILKNEGAFGEAEAFYRRSLAVQNGDDGLPDNPAQYAWTSKRLADLLVATGRNDEAAELYGVALEILENTDGTDEARLAEVRRDLSSLTTNAEVGDRERRAR